MAGGAGGRPSEVFDRAATSSEMQQSSLFLCRLEVITPFLFFKGQVTSKTKKEKILVQMCHACCGVVALAPDIKN